MNHAISKIHTTVQVSEEAPKFKKSSQFYLTLLSKLKKKLYWIEPRKHVFKGCAKLAQIQIQNLIYNFVILIFINSLLILYKLSFLGRIIGLFRLSYLTPGLMAAGVTEVIVEKDQDDTPANATVTNEADLTKKPDKKETKALAHQNGNKKSK